MRRRVGQHRQARIGGLEFLGPAVPGHVAAEDDEVDLAQHGVDGFPLAQVFQELIEDNLPVGALREPLREPLRPLR